MHTQSSISQSVAEEVAMLTSSAALVDWFDYFPYYFYYFLGVGGGGGAILEGNGTSFVCLDASFAKFIIAFILILIKMYSF